MKKINTAVTIDMDIFLEIKKRGINLSGLITEYLRGYLSLPRTKTEVEGKDVHLLLSNLRVEVSRLEKKKKKLDDLEAKNEVRITD